MSKLDVIWLANFQVHVKLAKNELFVVHEDTCIIGATQEKLVVFRLF